MVMRVGSLFSGIGGFDAAFFRAGAEVVWASEIDAFALKVYRERFSGVEAVGDITKWEPDPVRHHVDIICGGWPCQDLSVAGKREGLDGKRSGLFYEVVRVAGILRPTWLFLENVPGLLSSKQGDDFEAVLGALDNLGYGVAWRVFDAQAFGVPQRRRRLFIVCHLGAPCPPEVLFESEGVRGDPPPSRKARKAAAGAPARGARKGGEPAPAGTTPEEAARQIGQLEFEPGVIGQDITGTVSAKWVKGTGGPAGDEVYNLVAAEPVIIDEQNAAAVPVVGTLMAAASRGNRGFGVLEAVAFDARNGVLDGDVTHAIQSKPNGGMSLNVTPNVLTPTDPANPLGSRTGGTRLDLDNDTYVLGDPEE